MTSLNPLGSMNSPEHRHAGVPVACRLLVAALAILPSRGAILVPDVALPQPELYVRAESQIRQFDESTQLTGGDLVRPITIENPVMVGETLTTSDQVLRQGLEFTSSSSRAGYETGLGVEARSALPIGLLEGSILGHPRRSKSDAVARTVRQFAVVETEPGSVASPEIQVLVTGSGRLELNRLSSQAVVTPSLSTLYASVGFSVSMGIGLPGSFFGLPFSEVEGAQLDASGDLFVTNGWAPGWSTGSDSDSVWADFSWIETVSPDGYEDPDGVFRVPAGTPISLEYELGVTTFADYPNEFDNAAAWEAIADLGNSAEILIEVVTPGYTLVELPRVVPEPSAAVLWLAGLVMLVWRRGR